MPQGPPLSADIIWSRGIALKQQTYTAIIVTDKMFQNNYKL